MMTERRQLALDFKLRDDATFANYLGLAKARLDYPGQVVYLWGEAQSGRSHLLQACCHVVADAIYLQNLQSLSVEVLSQLEHRSLICLDDIDTVMGQADWEEALFHLINAVKDAGRRLVLVANQTARKLPVKLPDLHSRLLAAVSVETDHLTDEQKLAVLKLHAHNRGFVLKDEVGQFIMSRTSRDMRNLVDMLEQLEVESLRQQKRVTIPFVKHTLNL
ncbi:MAG: DnaA family protein [Candidatus Pseudothioglobus sp.]|jgi:DnaA family protein